MADVGLFWDFASGSNDSKPETASVDVGIFWGGACAGLPNRLIPEGRGALTVVARVQPLDLRGCSWAVWYSALTPTEEFKKPPLNYIRFGIGARIAKTMIGVIKSGGSLPAQLVEQLAIVKL